MRIFRVKNTNGKDVWFNPQKICSIIEDENNATLVYTDDCNSDEYYKVDCPISEFADKWNDCLEDSPVSEAEEKQIPKKVKTANVAWEFPNGQKGLSETHFCPECQEIVFANNVYCNRCGQRLEWWD